MPMTNILFLIVRICCSRFKGNCLKNENLFLNFFSHLPNIHPILNILKKKVIVIALVFPKLHTLKDLGRPLSKKRCFTTPIESQHVKRTPNLCEIFIRALLSFNLVTLRESNSGKNSFSHV